MKITTPYAKEAQFMPHAILLALVSALLLGCAEDRGQKSEIEIEQEWPTTCDGAISKLTAELPHLEKQKLSAMKKDDLILLHLGFGLGIRNEFGLWGGNFALIESCTGSPQSHPDEVSGIIIERLWASLQ